MTTENRFITCPKCGESIDIDDVLTAQIEGKLRKDFELKEKLLREAADKELAARLEIEKSTLQEKVRLEISIASEEEKKAQSEKQRLLEERLAEQEAKLSEARTNEIALLKEKQKLKDEKDAFEIEKARQMEIERKQIEEDASRKATEAQQARIDQLSKQLSDATKAKDELARKLEQGSQQTQGEVQELLLEEMLRSEFIYDDIVPVPKGVTGADAVQVVRTKLGLECGKIIWESKNTKTWTEGWVLKLKDDQRASKADLAVIVTTVLPKGVTGIAFRDGVWVCDIKLATAVGAMLRQSLEAVSLERSLSVGKNEKMESLYAYLTGTEFKQRVEAMVETFGAMNESLRKERIAYEKIWAEREKQIGRAAKSMVGMYGDLSGIVSLQKIDALELPEPSAPETTPESSD